MDGVNYKHIKTIFNNEENTEKEIMLSRIYDNGGKSIYMPFVGNTKFCKAFLSTY